MKILKVFVSYITILSIIIPCSAENTNAVIHGPSNIYIPEGSINPSYCSYYLLNYEGDVLWIVSKHSGIFVDENTGVVSVSPLADVGSFTLTAYFDEQALSREITVRENQTFESKFPVTDYLKGDTVYLTVYARNISNLYAFELEVLYSFDILEFSTVTSPLEGFELISNEDGQIFYGLTNIGDNVFEGPDLIATFEFKALEKGEADIRFKRVLMVDKEQNSLDFSEVNTLYIAEIKLPFEKGNNKKSDPIRLNLPTPTPRPVNRVGGGGGGSISPPKPAPTSTPTATPAPTPTPTPKPTPKVEVLQSFEDLPHGHWAKEYIDKLLKLKIVSGVSEKYFEPDRYITRAEFVKMLVNALDIESDGGLSFADVSEKDWYYPFIKRAYNKNIIKGYGNLFKPLSPITRQDMAVMVSRAINSEGLSSSVFYSDMDKISDYALKDVLYLSALGIISGFEDGSFKPLRLATRAEGCKFIASITNMGGKE